MMDKGAIKYLGYFIVEKRDFGDGFHLIDGEKVNTGFVITDGLCNVMPGATWARTVEQACDMIDDFIESKNDSAKFWRLTSKRKALAKFAEHGAGI